jgi:hypothetical protein
MRVQTNKNQLTGLKDFVSVNDECKVKPQMEDIEAAVE